LTAKTPGCARRFFVGGREMAVLTRALSIAPG
jgi:hypothetical protein